MSQTVPPAITAAPTPYPVRNDRTTFSARVDAFVTWLVAVVAQFAALATNVYDNAVDAYNSAVAGAASAAASAASAAASAATAGAVNWVSGSTYGTGVATISQVNFLTYRRTAVSPGSTVIDPANDPTIWVSISTPGMSPEPINRAVRQARLARFS